MFGTYFKSSLKALPWLVLLPVFVCALYIMVIDPQVIQIYGWSENSTHGEWVNGSDGVGIKYMNTGMAIAVAVNFLFLMVIPCAIGGTNSGTKRGQFYLGFFVNLALSLVIPFFWQSRFILDRLTFAILAGHCVVGFLLAFILGALFVAPAYARAFWFVNRR
ncbi:MAG: hypothetical protein LBK69_03405 [Syntrophomonadaceae bacterium]|jgi:hypothetical protein|nr:hypothetical protein [Syntrophomonadaceae bacterium]